MLPAATLAALMGIGLFQQQAELWCWTVWAGWGLLWLLVWQLPRRLKGFAGVVSPDWRATPQAFSCATGCLPPQRLLSLLLLVAMLGYAWAQFRAAVRMQSALPVACEQRVLSVQGVILSVPKRDASGQQFDLALDTQQVSNCALPPVVRLKLYADRTFPSRRDPQTQAKLLTQPTAQPYTSYPSHPTISPASPAMPVFHAGEVWRLHVKLKRPHGARNPHGFDYARWSMANGILATGSIVRRAPMQRLAAQRWAPQALIARWREQVGARIQLVLGDTHSSAVIRALVIGEDSQITASDWQLFVDTGINHLVSISGLHITMLAALGYSVMAALWRRVPRLALWLPSRLAASVSGAFIATAYALLAGFSIPTQRTLYMLLTVMLLIQHRRHMPFTWILSVAMCVVLLLDPWAVMAPGFWLSFGAVAVLTLAMGGRLRAAQGWRAAVTAQWVVTVTFIPLLILLFNQWSLISPLANALAIPLVSMAVVPLSIAGAVLPLDGALQAAAWLLQVCHQGLVWLHQWPWAVSVWPTPPLWAGMLACWGALIFLLPKGWPCRAWAWVLWLPAFVPLSNGLQPGQMRVTVIDVEQGLSVLVQTAAHSLLYDAGPVYRSGGESIGSDAGQRIVLPYLRHLGLKQLDLAVVSHDDNDHVGGMASVLTAVPAPRLLSALPPQAQFFKQWQQRGQGRPLAHQACLAGQHWQWEGVFFQVLWPLANQPDNSSDNHRSCVLRVVSAHGSLLLTGDIEREAEHALVAQYASFAQTQYSLSSSQRPPFSLKSTVMTMPHHGSLTSSTLPFVQAVDAQWAIASAGYRNRFGHPKPAVLARYTAQGTQVLRTDESGAVLLDFVSATQPQVTAWRQAHPHYWEQSD